MTDTVEAVLNAMQGVRIGMRTNKDAPLPFEIVDLSGDEPVVLSRWSDYVEAQAEHSFSIQHRRAIAAITAHEAALRDAGMVVVPREPTPAMLSVANDAFPDPPAEMTCSEFGGRLWRAMLAAALGDAAGSAQPDPISPDDTEGKNK